MRDTKVADVEGLLPVELICWFGQNADNGYET